MEPQQYCAYDGYPILGGICNECMRRDIKAAEERQLKKRREQEQKAALKKQREENQKQQKAQEKAKLKEKQLKKDQERLRKKQKNEPNVPIQSAGKSSEAAAFISGVFGIFVGYLSYKIGIYEWDLQSIPLPNSYVDALFGLMVGIVLAQISSTIRKISWGLLVIGIAYIGYKVL